MRIVSLHLVEDWLTSWMGNSKRLLLIFWWGCIRSIKKLDLHFDKQIPKFFVAYYVLASEPSHLSLSVPLLCWAALLPSAAVSTYYTYWHIHHAICWYVCMYVHVRMFVVSFLPRYICVILPGIRRDDDDNDDVLCIYIWRRECYSVLGKFGGR